MGINYLFPQLVNAGILSMIDMMHFLYNMWQHVPLKTTSHEISSLRLTDVSQAHLPILDDFWTLGIPSRWRHIHTKHVVFCLAVQTILQTCFWWKAISWDFIHGQSGKSVAYLTVIRQQTDPLPPNIWIDEITTFHRHCMQTRFCSHHRYGHEHASHRGRIRFFSTEILQNTRELGRHPTTLIFGPTEANIANIWHVLNTGDRMKTNPIPCCTLCCFTNQFWHEDRLTTAALTRTMPTGMSGKEKDRDDDKRDENNKSHENKALGCALKHATV